MGRGNGDVALVTGAAAGIGRATTRRLVADGLTVVAGDVDEAALDDLRGELGEAVVPVRCDVTDEGSVAELADRASRAGTVRAAVANAGRGHFAPIADHTLEDWQSIIDLCVTGVFLTVKHGARAMADGGSIVVVSSLNAVQPSAGMSAYCTAKAGVAMLTKVAAMELGHRGIRVNAVAPGLIRTAATGPFWLVPGVVEEFVENTTVGRFAEPEDVAALVSFLVGPESTFISGGLLPVDGGASTKRYPDLPAAFARLAGDGSAGA